MALPTHLLLEIIGGKLNEIDALAKTFHDELGVDPQLNMRLEIVLGAESYTISVAGNDIVVRDEANNRVIASGDREIATLALAGMASQEAAQPTPTPTG